MPLPKSPIALLIIDMQQGINAARLGPRNNPAAEKNIGRLLAAWRATGAPVVHIRHISRSPASVFWPGQPGVEFQTAFVPADAEHVVEKNVPDAFAQSALERWLRVRDIETLAIVGVATHNSVESTARSAGNLGFSTLVVADATFTFAQTDYNGVERAAEVVHAMALANLQGDYATVVSTASLLATN